MSATASANGYPLSGTTVRTLPLPFMAPNRAQIRAASTMAEKSDQNDDRDRHTKQEKQNGTHHKASLFRWHSSNTLSVMSRELA